MCGKWESFPREFAKCRRCRKAKYCGKECQSIAWSEGHRFWCSAKDPEDGDDRENQGDASRKAATNAPVTSGGTITGRAERRALREQERAARAQALEAHLTDELQRPGRVVVAVPPGTNPANTPTAINVVAPEAQRTRTTANIPAAFSNWAFSPLTLRRQRPARPEEGVPGATEPASVASAVTIRWRPRETSVPVVPTQEIELPNEVSRLLSINGDGGADDVQMTVASGAGPSRTDSGVGTDGDDPMIIG